MKTINGNVYRFKYTRDPGVPADNFIQIIADDIYEAIELFRENVDKDYRPVWLAEVKITDGFGNSAGTLIDETWKEEDMEEWDL